MINKDSVVWRRIRFREYEMVLAKQIEAGDILRGFDVNTRQYADIKVTSCIRVQNTCYKLYYTNSDVIFVSPDTFFLTSHGIWCTNDLSNYSKFKFVKKDLTIRRGANTATLFSQI